MIIKAYGLDLGTSVIKIYKKGKGIICNQKNIIALENDNVLAIGDDAFSMYEKVPENVRVTYPIKKGVIADIKNMDKLFETLLKSISKNGKVATSDFTIAVPMDITEVEKKAFIKLVDSNKARKVKTVPKPIAAAVGVGLDVCNARGAMIVDIGASTTEIAVISLGGIVISKLLPLGGETLNDAIISAVKKNYNLLIGRKTASKVKKALGAITKVSDGIYAIDNSKSTDEHICLESSDNKAGILERPEVEKHIENIQKELSSELSKEVQAIESRYEIEPEDIEPLTSMAICGRNMLTGLPEKVVIDSCLVVDAMHETLCSIVEGIKIILERTPPEISSDIIDSGIYMVGGCATIDGLDDMVRKQTGLKVNVSTNPSMTVVDGIGKIMETPALSKIVCKNIK